MASAASTIEIRPLFTAAELRQCQDVQRRAWGIMDDGYLVPVATLAAVAAYGGLVLGALVGERVVGFSFAFRGVIDGTPCLYSQLTGVLPEIQGSGIGRRIKAAQRAWARAQDLPLIVWAFDPMQAMNAHYNLVTLGAIATAYHPDFYGTRLDALNPGLPTDRLIAVWPTADPLPPKPESGARTVYPLLDVTHAGDGTRLPLLHTLEEAALLTIEIPADLAALRAAPERVTVWQAAIREAFTRAFAAGYDAVSFERGACPRYVLARKGDEGD